MTFHCDKLYDIISRLLLFNSPKEKANLNETEILHIIQLLLLEINVPEYQYSEDVPYAPDYFEGVSESSERTLKNLYRILEEIHNVKVKGYDWSSGFIRSISQDILFTVASYSDENCEWSSTTCSKLARDVSDKIAFMCNCQCIEELLIGYDHNTGVNKCKLHKKDEDVKTCELYFPNGITVLLLQKLSEKFTKENWKRFPALMCLYYWILTRLKNPYLTDYLGYLLPPTLFILDDWEQKHKVLGLNACKYIINNSAHSELRWYGRAHVIYDALKNTLYTREAVLLQHVYPTILEAANVIESDPDNSNKIAASLYDNILQHLTAEMAHEQKLGLRKLYIKFLGIIITKMGIMSVRWSTIILDICEDYAITYEGPQGQDRLEALKVLSVFITECWPRVHCHAKQIMKIIIRLLYEISHSNCRLETQAIILLQEECESVVKLLTLAAPIETKQLTEGLQNVKVHKNAQNSIFRICEISNQSNS